MVYGVTFRFIFTRRPHHLTSLYVTKLHTDLSKASASNLDTAGRNVFTCYVPRLTQPIRRASAYEGVSHAEIDQKHIIPFNASYFPSSRPVPVLRDNRASAHLLPSPCRPGTAAVPLQAHSGHPAISCLPRVPSVRRRRLRSVNGDGRVSPRNSTRAVLVLARASRQCGRACFASCGDESWSESRRRL